MYTCTKFQQYITNNRLVVVKYSSAIFSLSLQKSEKWPKVKGQFELFRLQSAHEGSLHIRFYFYFNWLWNSEFFWVLCFEFAKKCAKKGRNDQRSKVSLSLLDCNQHRRDLCIYDSIFISIDFETISIFEFFYQVEIWYMYT